jgi:dolichol-phosphate mannosyltransferase
MSQTSFELIVVIPVYNEEGCIEEVITSWGDFLTNYFNDKQFRILVINDGSKDNTPIILDKLASRLSYLEVVHQKNGGHGNAVLNGYRKAVSYQPNWVFQTDSDNQFRPEDFPHLWEHRTHCAPGESCILPGLYP